MTAPTITARLWASDDTPTNGATTTPTRLRSRPQRGPRLHELLAASADRHPDRAAFVRDGATTTYAELARDVARFAASLRRTGVSPGDRVVLAHDGTLAYLVAYYGIVQCGAVVVPVCPDTRPEPLTRAIAHSGATAAVIEARAVQHLAGYEAALPDLRTLIVVGAVPDQGCSWRRVPIEQMVAGPEELSDSGMGDGALASIAYTSGTTGIPKGVMLTHRNLVANILAVVAYLELGLDDVVGMVLPFFYVYGNSVLHTHLCAGGTVAWLGSMAFPARVASGLEAHRCTGFSGVPSTFARLLTYDHLGEHDLSALRYVTQAGAAMSPPMIRRLRAALPNAEVFVMYGQTEAAARLTYLPPADLDRKPGSVGRPIAGVTLSVVDAQGFDLPPGTVGEVVARGPSIMSGYWRDPEETSRALRPEGLRTGDLGRMDEEGYLTIVGRASDMIKSGAHRISPRTIEDVILRLDGVAECAVVGVPDEQLGQAILACVVRRPGCEVTRQDVMRQCHRDLPRFQLPSEIRFLQELPRTPTGKVRTYDLERRP